MEKVCTKNFSKSKILLLPSYLLSVQKQGWKMFWEDGLSDLFSEISPIRDYSAERLEVWFLDYRLGKPNYKNDLEAKKNNDSYEAPLRVKVRLVNLKNKETQEQEIFLTDFPLMTEKGTFIINGIERVVILQLTRSPGVFFTVRKIGDKNYFGAKIIPNRGSWIEFETESNGFIGVKIDRKRKVAATTLLKAFGIGDDQTIKEIFKDVDIGEIKYIEKTFSKDITYSQDEALMEIYQRLRPNSFVTLDSAQQLIQNMFFNFERYDLSKIGRRKMSQRLLDIEPKNSKDLRRKKLWISAKAKANKEKITIQDRVLRPEDVVTVLKEIIRLNNDPEAQPDEIDHLGNRRVKTINELLQDRLRIGLTRIVRGLRDKMSTLDSDTLLPSQLINPGGFMAAVKEFFTSSQISQFMDSENPLSELEHKRRLSCTGPGGLDRKRAGFDVRDVQTSHYGRICPIHTPEGSNIGLVNHLSSLARINPYGFFETPYFKVKKGKITSEIQYLDAHEEERFNIASASALVDKNKMLQPKKVEARINGKPGQCSREKINFIDASPAQCLSLAASLIPFLQNTDASRALMGANMQRQAVPLFNPGIPRVMSGSEERIARDSGQEIIAENDGKVIEVDADHIVIKSDSKLKTYNLTTFIQSNRETCFHQKPLKKKGQKIEKGDVLVDGGAISQGRLSLGQNVLVAFMSWRGWNFEDAVIISERLLKDDVYTSIHIESFSCNVRRTKLGPEITTSDIPNVSEDKLKNLDEEGIVRVGTEVFSGDILVGKISPKGEIELTAEERLLRAIFGEKAKEVKDSSLLVKHGRSGRVIDVKVFSRAKGHKFEPGIIKRIEIKIAQIRKIQAGDKITGRHGNKGVISKILPEEEMPYLKDGTPVDIIMNPLSIASRMNIGQILEAHLGWAAKKLGYYAISPALAGASEKDIKKELKRAGFSEDGKVVLYDSKDGQLFPEKIMVGYIYIVKLNHMVKDIIHMRSIGPYSLITQQPLKGKAQFGAQRFGEMEVWALEGYGARHILQEMLTIKSDDIAGRIAAYEAILKNKKIEAPGIPTSFNLLVLELKSLGLSVEVKEKLKEKSKEQSS